MRYKHTVDEARIRGALGNMPYGGGIQTLRDASNRVGLRDGAPAPVELSDVADYLEMILRQYRADIAAVRRVFGMQP